MPLPNPEVYGSQETWSKCATFYFIGEGNPDTKTIAPQINVWDSESVLLTNWYFYNNKTARIAFGLE